MPFYLQFRTWLIVNQNLVKLFTTFPRICLNSSFYYTTALKSAQDFKSFSKSYTSTFLKSLQAMPCFFWSARSSVTRVLTWEWETCFQLTCGFKYPTSVKYPVRRKLVQFPNANLPHQSCTGPTEPHCSQACACWRCRMWFLKEHEAEFQTLKPDVQPVWPPDSPLVPRGCTASSSHL